MINEKKIFCLLFLFALVCTEVFAQIPDDSIAQHIITSKTSYKDAPTFSINNKLESKDIVLNSNTCAVGAIHESNSVNPNGSSSVNVDIDIPQDPTGFTPKVSLSYNSMGAAGHLGWGWFLQGASFISKQGGNYYYDGYTSDIDIDRTNAFYLDGVRLILTYGTPMFHFYKTEKGNVLARAVFLRRADAILFEVKYPNGNKSFFKKSDKFGFYLTEAQDAFGHSIYYEYIDTNAGPVLSSITYNKGRYKIEFEYESIPANYSIIQYTRGIKRNYDKLLKSIKIFSSSNIIKTYSISYKNKNEIYQIESVNCESGNSRLVPLKFTYGDGNNEKEFVQSKAQLDGFFKYENPSELVVQRAKFKYGTNSDGVVIYPNHISNYEMWRNATMTRHSKDYFFNEYSDTQEILVADGVENDFAFNKGKLLTGPGFQGVICGDVDDKQGDEVIRINEYLENGKDYTDITTYVPNIYGSLVKTHSFKKSFNDQFTDCHHNNSVIPKVVHIGDFNGDGYNEILAISPCNLLNSGNKTYIYIIDMINGNVLYEKEAPFSFNKKYPSIKVSNGNVTLTPEDAENQSDKIYIQDVNGDGKSDIVLVSEDGTSTYSFKTDKNGIKDIYNIGKDIQLKKSTCEGRKIFQADLNGDNIADFFITPAKNSSGRYSKDYQIYFSKGDGTYESSIINNIPDYYEGRTDFFEDVDLDGTSDYVVYSQNSGEISVYPFKNGKRVGEIKYNIGKNGIVIPADISSYSKVVSILAIQDKGLIKKLIYKGNEFNDRLLTGYTNSYGIAKEFKYCNLYNSSSIQGYNAKKPFINYNGPLVITTNYIEKANNDIVTDLEYKYENAIFHKQGRGFRGYEKIYTYDLVSGENNTSVYDVFNDGLLLSSSNEREKISYTYEYKIDTNKINNTTLQKMVVDNHVDKTTITTDYIYDEYNNVKQKTTDYGNGYVKIDKYDYSNIVNSDTYVLGLVTSETHEIDRKGLIAESKEEKDYDGILLAKKKQYVNGNNLVNTTDYEYNEDGLPTKVTNTSFNSDLKHTTSFVYNTYGLLLSKTGEDGLTQEFTYNDLDQMVGVKNYLGNSVFKYDQWGNLIWAKSPNGTIEEYELAWSNDNVDYSYYKKHKSTGKPGEITYYDKLGRIVREGRQRYDGLYLFTDKKYNNKGLLMEVSEPFKEASSKKTIYSYDRYDRIVQVKTANGSIDEYKYNPLEIVVKHNGKSTTKKYNELGDLLYVESPNGKVIYEYNKNGDICKVTSPGNVSRTFDYDVFGRRTSINDPNVGVRYTEYNNEGKIIQESSNDASKTISYSYDNQGRLLCKSYSDNDMIYEYNEYGELILEHKSDNSYSKEVTYDDYHRLSKVITKNGDVATLMLDYTYKDGNLSSLKYTTGKGIVATLNYTYQNGVLTEATLNGDKAIWKLISEDEQGRATEYKSLDIRNKYTFDKNDLLSSMSTFKDNKLLHQETYEFDALTNNLTKRSNHHGLTDVFEYDSMDRIVKFNNQTITYDELGNITDNSLIGKYDYSIEKPYVVSKITPCGDDIPAIEQRITYNALNKPLVIEEGSYKSIFSYGTNDERIKMESFEDNDNKKTKYYIDSSYELVETTNGYVERLYLLGDAYSAPVVLVNENGKQNLYSIVRDYLSSIKAIYDENGSLVQELSYDAWGRLRDPQTGAIYNKDQVPVLFLDRGYTSHEHLCEYDIINMNGRLYDPVLGRFLNPDPVVQDGDNAQNYNSYSYVLNNPLKYTDKSGKFLVAAIIGCVVGAYIGGCIANKNANPLKWDYSSPATYLGITFGAILGGYIGCALAGAGYAFTFSISTPFIAVGVGVSYNKYHTSVDYGFATPGGGGWSHGMQKATENAEKAYHDAIVTAHDIMSYVSSDLSNHPVTPFDIFSETIDYMGDHISDYAASGYYALDKQLSYYSSKSNIPTGVKFYEVKDLAKNTCKWIGRGCWAYSVYATGENITETCYNENLSMRNKYSEIGAEIGGFIGGIATGVAVTSLTSLTGPASIGAGITAGAIGACAGRWLGGFIGGLIYDIHSMNSTIQYQINTNQQYDINFDGLMLHP